MELQRKEIYAEPVLATHELLRDITGTKYQEKTQDKFTDKTGREI